MVCPMKNASMIGNGCFAGHALRQRFVAQDVDNGVSRQRKSMMFGGKPTAENFG